ncbi:MAG: YbjN domain-containing protein [Armatimonadetes bacterium]|nr:YbjN domain-containing protein [Armatimonadota bacterium]
MLFGKPKGDAPGPPDLDEVTHMLNQLELKYSAYPEKNAVGLFFEGDHGDFDVFIVVEREMALVYIAVARYLEVPSDHPRLDRVIRRLMELNWNMPLGKLEWDPRDGEVRLSYAFTTEDGLGPRALGTAINYLVEAADEHIEELRKLVAM